MSERSRYFVVCPYCGFEDDSATEDVGTPPEKIECGECGREFMAWVENDPSYVTMPMKEWTA